MEKEKDDWYKIPLGNGKFQIVYPMSIGETVVWKGKRHIVTNRFHNGILIVSPYGDARIFRVHESL